MFPGTQEDKIRAWEAVKAAKRSGRLRAPDACSRCERDGRVQAHHWDYTKPLDVEWLCTACHSELHELAEAAADEDEFRTLIEDWYAAIEDDRAYMDPAYPDWSEY